MRNDTYHGEKRGARALSALAAYLVSLANELEFDMR